MLDKPLTIHSDVNKNSVCRKRYQGLAHDSRVYLVTVSAHFIFNVTIVEIRKRFEDFWLSLCVVSLKVEEIYRWRKLFMDYPEKGPGILPVPGR